MQITTVQWNIGGGKTLRADSDPTLMSSYNNEGMDDIVQYLKSVQPDIITLQEIHISNDFNQAEYIASQLGLDFWISDVLSDSHIEEGQKLGQAIISKFPITDKAFDLYINPNKVTASEDGTTTWHSHDKGLTRCVIDLGEVKLVTATTHLTPFRLFSIDTESDEGRSFLDDIERQLIHNSDFQLVQGDFNLNHTHLDSFFPNLIDDILEEVPQGQGTTPKGRLYDHVLYRGIRVIKSTVNNEMLTDHYPVLTKFEV